MPASQEYREHVQLAQKLEQSGELKEALDQWKIAGTLKPGDEQSESAVRRVEADIADRAEQAYREGMEDWKKGLWKPARKNFLIALRLNPDHQKAYARLFERPKRPQGMLVHRVAPGETLSVIAGKYYGDILKYRYLAAYNKIENPAKLKVGQEIFIPGIEAVQTRPGVKEGTEEKVAEGKAETKTETEEKVETETQMETEMHPEALSEMRAEKTMARAEPQAETVGQAGKEVSSEAGTGDEGVRTYKTEEEIPDSTELYYLQAVALYREKDYESAAFEFQKVINVDPNYKEAATFYKESAYLLGRRSLSEGKLEHAHATFKALVNLDPKYKEAAKYLRITEERIKDHHYRRGIKYYEKEKLKEALAEWKRVYAMDPKYKKVEFYINRCQQILQKLEELKSSGT